MMSLIMSEQQVLFRHDQECSDFFSPLPKSTNQAFSSMEWGIFN